MVKKPNQTTTWG